MCTTQPNLTSLVPVDDMLKFNCSFEYRGRWAPTIKWFNTDNVAIASKNTGTFNRSVIHAITVPVTRGMHGKRIRAEVFFEDPLFPPPSNVFSPELDHLAATNSPEYEHRFESNPIMVACK